MKVKSIFLLLSFWILFITKSIGQQLATCVRVKDGDTYVLRGGSGAFTVRLNKIDAPEKKQKSGYGAYHFVDSIITGKVVQYTSLGNDRYGRTLAFIKVNGLRLDSLIISNGWAWHYLHYDHETMLDVAMQNAIDHKLGLWYCGVANVCPPWIYRSSNSFNRAKYCTGCSVIINSK